MRERLRPGWASFAGQALTPAQKAQGDLGMAGEGEEREERLGVCPTGTSPYLPAPLSLSQ